MDALIVQASHTVALVAFCMASWALFAQTEEVLPSEVACEDCTQPPCGGSSPAHWNAGIELTFLKPRFDDNVAFTMMQADGASFESFRDTEFDYDLEFAPRVWLGLDCFGGLGMRATYWQQDQDANPASGSPPANGFGRVDHPAFGNIDISSTIPSDTFTASSGINAYTIDLEATRQMHFHLWTVTAATGLRYASVEQFYLAELTNNVGTTRGRINFRQRLEGFGPTLSLNTGRPLTCDLAVFGYARGAMLWADGESQLNAGEDLDLATPFLTDRVSNRDDFLPIGEIQVGLQWLPLLQHSSPLRPFVTAALEGQIWSNAGNASSENGDLGFFGFNVGLGFTR